MIESPQHGFLFRLIADERERATADGVLAEFIAQFLDGFSGLDVATKARHQRERMEERIGDGKMQDDGITIRHIDAFELPEVRRIRCAGLRVLHSRQGECDVV